MKNPWLKKNPFMSMWLSGAHKAVGAARGQATAAARREASKASKTAATAATRQTFVFWEDALGGAKKPKKRR